MWIGVVALVLGSLGLVALGRRAMAGTSARNRFFGLQVRSTLVDDESWDTAHRAAGSALVSTGVAGVGLAITSAVIGMTADEQAATGSLLVAVVIVALGVLVSVRLGIRALAEAQAADGTP